MPECKAEWTGPLLSGGEGTLQCVVTDANHPYHIVKQYPKDHWVPVTFEWENTDYVPRVDPKAQAAQAEATMHKAAREIRRAAREGAPSLVDTRIRRLTRMGQVANVLVANVGQWVDGWRLANVETGGSEGLKRLRELRQDYGWPIENRPDPSGRHTTDQYRLTQVPEGLPEQVNR